jgi:hypothetical protein
MGSDQEKASGGFFSSPLFLATILAFAVYYGLPEAWKALPEVDQVDQAYNEVIDYIDQYSQPTPKANNSQPKRTSKDVSVCSKRLDAVEELNKQLK